VVVSVDAEIPRSGTLASCVVVVNSACVVGTSVSTVVAGASVCVVVVGSSVVLVVLLDEDVLVSATVVVVDSVVVVAGAVVVGAGLQVTVVETVFETPFTVAVAV